VETFGIKIITYTDKKKNLREKKIRRRYTKVKEKKGLLINYMTL
jgi:hypothetical protein